MFARILAAQDVYRGQSPDPGVHAIVETWASRGSLMTTLSWDFLSPSARSRFSPSADGGAPTPSRGSIRAWIPGIGTMRSGLSRSIPLSVFAAVSFAIEYARTIAREVDGVTLHALPLERIIVTKRATNRPKDLALLPILEATLLAKKASPQTD